MLTNKQTWQYWTFDKVSHKCLLYKLQWYGADLLTHACIADFLRNRTQAVVLEGKTSSVPVSSGVPQGTVLGPTLFLVYINECISNSTFWLFADDCILYRQIDRTADCQSAGWPKCTPALGRYVAHDLQCQRMQQHAGIFITQAHILWLLYP